MNRCHPTHSDPSATSMSQRLIEALVQLQAQASNSIRVSVYIYDAVEQHTLFASCSVAAMLGYTADAIHEMGTVGLGDLIHPDDLDVISEHYQHLTSLQWGEVITVNYRMRRADGTWCLIRSQETPLVQSSNGMPLQIVGLVQVSPQVLTPTLDDLLCRAGFSNSGNMN